MSKKKRKNLPSPGNKLAVKALAPSSSDELLDAEKERREAAVVLSSVDVVASADVPADASASSGAPLRDATEAALFRLPKSAFIEVKP